MNQNSHAMREIAIAAKKENAVVSALLGKTQKDSNTVKILTYTALIYLPANLVAVGTNLEVLIKVGWSIG